MKLSLGLRGLCVVSTIKDTVLLNPTNAKRGELKKLAAFRSVP